MIDNLSSCLSACQNLAYDSIHVKSDLLDSFRLTAWQIISDPQCQWSPQCESVRRKLWRLIHSLATTPRCIVGTLGESLEFGDGQFTNAVEQSFGADQLDNANRLDRLWVLMVQNDAGSLRQVFRDQVRLLRDSLIDFRVLARPKLRPAYASILEELELKAQSTFCSASEIKKQSPFDCLITCGPFRENDFLFTAPRYSRILNIRWRGDEDFGDFPNFLTIRNQSEDDPQFPDDFPVNVSTNVDVHEIEFAFPPQKIKTDGSWSYHDFEEIYIPRRNRANRLLRRRGNPNGSGESASNSSSNTSASETERPEYSKISFFNGAYLIQDFDQQKKPRHVLSIDPEGDLEIKKRRPFASNAKLDGEFEDDFLKAGMLAVIKPPASSELQDAASEDSSLDIYHLPKWKSGLREKLQALRDSGQSVKFAMQRIGLDQQYANIEGALQRWSEYVPGRTASPGSFDVFEKLLRDFIEYDKWEAAWDELNGIWNESISVGLTSNSNIGKYLIASVEKHLDEILAGPFYTLPVEGFKNDVLVLEIQDIQLLSRNQIYQTEVNKIVGLDFD